MKAYIKTEGPGVVVDLVNISRGGVCFTSVADFRLGTKVLIATHYIEGGHNIFSGWPNRSGPEQSNGFFSRRIRH